MSEVVQMTQALADKLVVLRRGKDAGGYQRKLYEKRIPQMARALGNGIICPAIQVGRLNGELHVIDGQHRLEAWKRSHFPLRVEIHNLKDKRDASRNFATINATQKRVARDHILDISDDPWSVEVRRIARKHNVTNTHVDSLLCGVSSSQARQLSSDVQVKAEKFLLAETAIAAWKRDPRWGKAGNGVFDKPGTLKLVGRIVRQAKNEHDVIDKLKRLLSLNWGVDSALAYCYGSGHGRQLAMIKEANKQAEDLKAK